MAVEVVVPKMGMTMKDGTIVEWSVPDGSEVQVGDVIFRLATDKLDTDVEAEAACHLLADDYLAWPPGVGTPATGDDDAVLVEVEAVERADEFHLLVEGRPRIGEARSQGAQAVEGYVRLRRPHARQTRDLADHTGGVRAGIHVEVGRITRGEDPREG